MKVGYCSPFNPLKSGISDFSEELVEVLAQHVEIVVFSPVEPENKHLMEVCQVRNIKDLDKENIRKELDVLVYHVGNNWNCHREIVKMLEKYPGIVELHDVGLHYMAIERILEDQDWEEYKRLAEYCHGKRGRKIVEDYLQGIGDAPWSSHPLDMSMTRNILERSIGVIVHSEFAKQMVLALFPEKAIANIMLHSCDIVDNSGLFQQQCRRKLCIPENEIIIGSFGFATYPKRILPILDALGKIKAQGSRFQYVLVGEVQKEINIHDELKKRDLCDCVTITGFTSLEDFKLYMGACDFCVNLRYPTQGESSASLHRMLGMGKPVIVTDIGTFADYPDEIVLKVGYDAHEVEDIYNAILLLLNNKSELKKRSEKALKFAREYCDLRKNAKMYVKFFEEILQETWQADYEDISISRLLELGLTNKHYLEHFYRIISMSLNM